eukprot:Hpha_TRINITY_DN15784_c0_g1::TRINITY_DN15784_c0_g1_i1::g.37784::m.37784/K10415/DYNC1I, DNCI; dynein intermediate chain, cytosolic
MTDLQAELTDKRRKLAELRARRAEQGGGAAAATPASGDGASGASARPTATASATGSTTGLSANERLRLMREQRAAKEAGAAAGAPASGGAASAGSPSRTAGLGSPADIVNRIAGVSREEVARVQRASRAQLKMVRPDRLQWDVAPQGKADHYEKQAQTDPVEYDGMAGPGSPVGSPRRPDFRKAVAAGAGQEQPKEEDLEEKQADEGELADLGDVPSPRGLTEEDRDRIMAGQPFRQFVRDASFLVERALRDDDWLMPCAADSGEAVTVGGAGEAIVRRLTLSDASNQKLTKHCPVTSVDFNSTFGGNPELFVASYYKRSEDTSIIADVEGSVLVWSMKVTERPFQQLRAPCDVARAIYCKYNGNLVLGAMYNGQVCVWDTREGPKPVQVSPLTIDGHTYPVFGIEVVGTTNSHQLVTLSADGKICTWQMEKLAAPTDSTSLVLAMDVGGTVVPRELFATSLGFRDMDASKFFIGSDNGMLFAGNRSSPGSNLEGLEGHTSPITSLHCHPVNPGSHEDFGDLILTSSMDWTCKLWMPARSNRHLFSFDEHTDFVYDARWSPEHPSVFASVDGSGTLSVYHLGESMETPLAKGQVVSPSSDRPRACSCLSWTGDGRFVGVGSAAGDMSIWQVSQRVAEPAESEWKKLREKLQEINAV